MYDENGADCLLDMGISIHTGIEEEDIDTPIFPMFVDGFLDNFTRSELLSGENVWKCEKCASNLDKSSDYLEKRTT